MKNKAFHIISAAILTALISYIAINEIKARHNAKSEIARHAQVVAEALWNFEREAPKAYVEQAIRNNFYEKFTIKTDSGKVLFSSTGHPLENLLDRILARLKLIPPLSLSCNVMYKGIAIGQIDIVARIKTIYSNLYALALGLLSFLAVKFFFIILKANQELDYRVHERTAELEDEINERQKVEETLRESEEKFRLIVENSPLAIVHLNKDGLITTCNGNLCKLMGSSKENLIGFDTYKKIKDKKMITAISTALSGKNSHFKGDYVSVSGSVSGYLEAYLGPIFSVDGSLLGAIGVFADISKRKQAEEELIREKAFTEKVVNSMPGVFYTFNEDQHLIKWNKNLENLLGKSAEEITQDEFNIFSYIPDEEKDRILKEVRHAQRTGENLSLEAHFITKDGSKVPMLFTASHMNIEDKKYLLGVGIDISDKKKLEAELQQAQKMEAIGTLAGGIAHDFNNILAAILGYTELAKDEINDVESLRKDLDEIFKGAERAKELVKQILTFSRKNDLELKPLKIQFVIKEALKLLRSSIPTTIEIKQEIDSDCDAILADPTQIHQVIMNLCTNAYHAMRETGGVLGVSLKSVELTSDIVDNKINLSPGSYIRLEISDTGVGIPKDVQDRIFEPYYTTKPKGEGTGLGLAVVHGIVTSLNGDITLYSEIDSGTTFRIYLPVVASAIKTIQKKTTRTLPTGDESILLVDDDQTIVTLISKILERLGYKVTTFTDSIAALQKFQQLPNAFDLIITDMTMPHMTGAELSKVVLKMRPDMKIIMCTGFSDIINEDKAKTIGICDYVMKPVVKDDLAVVVRKALDGS